MPIVFGVFILVVLGLLPYYALWQLPWLLLLGLIFASDLAYGIGYRLLHRVRLYFFTHQLRSAKYDPEKAASVLAFLG